MEKLSTDAQKKETEEMQLVLPPSSNSAFDVVKEVLIILLAQRFRVSAGHFRGSGSGATSESGSGSGSGCKGTQAPLSQMG